MNLIYISLSCAFIANVITLQNGPLFVFSHFRKFAGVWIAKKSAWYGQVINSQTATERQKNLAKLSGYSIRSAGELINCPFCLAPWFALVGVAIFANDNILANWLVCSGMIYIFLGWINGKSH